MTFFMQDKHSLRKYSQKEIQQCLSLLEGFTKDSAQLAQLSEEERIALMKAAGQLSRPYRDEIAKRKYDMRKLKRQRVVSAERGVRAQTGIRQARASAVFTAPKQITDAGVQAEQSFFELKSPRNCYVCKAEYQKIHFFYDAMCPKCAAFNYEKRFQRASLVGRVALITGSRLKIGYQATLMMLRAGATVIATTRFPVDSALRFAKEEDFAQWKDRLHVYGLDLRHTPSVEIFCSYVEQKYEIGRASCRERV